jgi:ATP-binding cassette subfamily C protein
MGPTVRALDQFVIAIARMSRPLVFFNIALTLGVGLAEGVGLLVLIPLLQLVGLDAQQGSLGRIVALFASTFAAVGLAPTLPAVLALYVAIVSGQAVLQRQQSAAQARLREAVVHRLRVRLYAAIAATTWVYFSRTRASVFGEMLTRRVDRVATAAYYLLDIFATGVLALVYVALAFRVSPAMTGFVVICGALLALVLRERLHIARRAGEQYTDASTRLYSATFDHLESMKMAKGYGAERRHTARFAELSTGLATASIQANDASARTRQWVAIGSAVLLAFIVYVAQGVLAISAAGLFLLVFLFARLVPRVTSLYEKAQVLALELPAFESVIEAESECLAAAETEPLAHEALSLERAIECSRVTFTYREAADVPALDNVTLTISAHATTAIVGPSGAGKSTLADLLMGLVEPASGMITADGVPLSRAGMQSWRSHIGYVSQETFLFHDTIRANLLWAKPGASDDQIWTSLVQAAASDFVRALPQGLDTVIGDRGVLLSGGERQRLSLARALLRQPQVLILDEATSSLDSENERRIQAAIDQLHEQITIVVITHRLSTIRNADVIYVLERGRVVESGSWRSLLSAGSSRFRTLCDSQGIDSTLADGPTTAATRG